MAQVAKFSWSTCSGTSGSRSGPTRRSRFFASIARQGPSSPRVAGAFKDENARLPTGVR